MALYIVHVTDTHYANDAEDIQASTTRKSQYQTSSIVQRARRLVLSRHGCARAELNTLWPTFIDQLGAFTNHMVVTGTEMITVHSGDITQAGQPQSLHDALGQIAQATSPCGLHALTGNHDVWPRDFPAFSPARTSLQARYTRSLRPLPTQFPHHVPTSTVDIVMFDSTVPDTMLNITALGRVDAELSAADFVLEVDQVQAPRGNFRGAVMHHPPADIATAGQSWWRSVQQQVGFAPGMVLLDSQQLRQRLFDQHIAFVLCGHEHAPPHTSDDAIADDGRLLILQSGCPTLVRGAGNNADPQFSVFELDCFGSPTIHWYICRLDYLRWEAFGSFEWDASTRTWSVLAQPKAVPAAFPGARLPKPPPLIP